MISNTSIFQELLKAHIIQQHNPCCYASLSFLPFPRPPSWAPWLSPLAEPQPAPDCALALTKVWPCQSCLQQTGWPPAWWRLLHSSKPTGCTWEDVWLTCRLWRLEWLDEAFNPEPLQSLKSHSRKRKGNSWLMRSTRWPGRAAKNTFTPCACQHTCFLIVFSSKYVSPMLCI